MNDLTMLVKRILLLFLFVFIVSCASKNNNEESQAVLDGDFQTESQDTTQAEPATTDITIPDINKVPTEDIIPDAANKKVKETIYEVQNRKLLNTYNQLVADSPFKINDVFNYYGNQIAILKIDTIEEMRVKKRNEISVKVQEDSNEAIKNSPSYLEAEELLNFNVKNTNEDAYLITGLTDQHRDLLIKLIANAKNNPQTIIFVYINANKLSQFNTDDLRFQKTIYSQYIVDYLYANLKNLVIEKRYMQDIPSDEIFLIAYRYEGEIPYNYFNSPKTSSLEWLNKYRELEEQRMKELNKIREDLEKSLQSIATLDLAQSDLKSKRSTSTAGKTREVKERKK